MGIIIHLYAILTC